MRTLKIYFTSDIHGYFFPPDSSQGAMPLGLFQCAKAFCKDGNTLIIDGGDVLQGSALNQYCWRILHNFEVLADMMNACGYDYVTLGNHDFNFGKQALSGYLNRLNAACLCENVQDESGRCIFPHTIHTLENGMKVGLVGIVTDFVNLWEKPEHIEGLQITDPLDAARNALALIKDKTDLTICIYHGGFECDLDTGKVLSDSGENIACRICTELDFDILLTGHQHMPAQGRYYCGTYIIQPPEQGRGCALLEVTQAQGNITVHSSIELPKLTPSVSYADSSLQRELNLSIQGCVPSTRMQFADLESNLQIWLDEPVGTLAEPIEVGDRIQMALHGAPLADLFNMLQLRNSGAQISASSLANDARGLPELVRRRDLFTAYPYTNTFVLLEITGKHLRAAVERSAEYLEYDAQGQLRISDRFLKPKVEHYNHDYFYPLATEIDYMRPIGSRVISMQFEDHEVVDDATFTICTNDYRASGAGGYPMYPQCRVIQEIRHEMTDFLLDYFDL
ncbi:MAG: bifunctional metallophosphatase/5'-nucleotidase [Oscillospiraceae bacterium]|nr:bifunctional metallophosphatase/5'-nucleotidase [Oscillospiraceae bacterium]